MKIFGIDPGCDRTGYGCIDTDGSRHRLIVSGAIKTSAVASFPDKLLTIHTGLAALLGECRPDCVAIENLFHAANARSALKLGHARGVAMLAAVEAGLSVVEYTPAEIKRAVVGYGRAEKHQVQQMVKLILGLAAAPVPHDAADALAVAICHVHSMPPAVAGSKRTRPTDGAATESTRTRPTDGATVGGSTRTRPTMRGKAATSWRHYRPAR